MTSIPVSCCPVVELRQYSLHPGTRETLITLFEREFVEPQEAAGMCVIGQFRDLDRPDVFTWLRGFPDMTSRAESLSAFYDGSVWAEYRDQANATMISSDNVRLLRPAIPSTGFVLGDGPPGAGEAGGAGLFVATIYTLSADAAPKFSDLFYSTLVPCLAGAGAWPIASFITEPSVNTFPRLPVREGENAFVWFAHFDDVAEYGRHVLNLAADHDWRTSARRALEQSIVTPPEVWRLAPTARSRSLR